MNAEDIIKKINKLKEDVREGTLNENLDNDFIQKAIEENNTKTINDIKDLLGYKSKQDVIVLDDSNIDIKIQMIVAISVMNYESCRRKIFMENNKNGK